MYRVRNKKGYTLVELLAVIVIVGILSALAITGVSRLIQRARDSQLVQQEKTVSMAAESYLQANRSIQPKEIGEIVTISVQDLKSSKFLKEDVKNSSGESCMKHSYVQVKKVSKTAYDYDTHFYCGKQEPKDDEVEPVKPTANVRFLDVEEYDNVAIWEKEYDPSTPLTNVSNARVAMKITGGINTSVPSTSDEKTRSYKIMGYSYSISVSYGDGDSDKREIYSSGTLSAGNNSVVLIDTFSKESVGNLNSYIDVTTTTKFYVHVSARNEVGGVLDEVYLLGGKELAGVYRDSVAPTCGEITGQAPEGEWINKANKDKKRIITATCEDGDGSGCIREKFSMTWPRKNQKAMEYAYIQVKDNAGNTNFAEDFSKVNQCDVHDLGNTCKVRVNYDIDSPIVTVDAYKRTDDGKITGNSIFGTGVIKSNKNVPSDTVTITASQYNDSVNNAGNGWMNAANFPNGVIYNVNISDNLNIASWEWKTNPAEINSTTDAKYKAFSSSNPDGVALTAVTPADNRNNCGVLSKNITVSFTNDGRRAGQLIVKDKAGNTVTFTIYANLDRSAPKPPTVVYKKVGDNSNYTPGNWSTKKIDAAVSGADTAGSGWRSFEYSHQKQNGKNGNTVNYAAAKTGGFASGSYRFSEEGYHKIKYRGCDNANNCSSYTADHIIMIDTIPPKCTINISYPNGGVTKYGWLGSGKSAKLSQVCTEVDSKGAADSVYGSQCNRSKLLPDKIYDSAINTTKAGVVGVGDSGYVYDMAGNSAKCAADKTVRIDTTAPTCVVTRSSKGTETNGWLKKGGSVTLSKNCGGETGTNASGCDPDSIASKTYTASANITNGGVISAGNSGTVQDKAGNKSAACAANYKVKIDADMPKCTVNISYSGGNPVNGWLGIGKTAKVYASCSDTGGSGCSSATSYNYTTNLNITDAGSEGRGKPGYVVDTAGNRTNCSGYKTVKIDHTRPTCGTVKYYFAGTKTAYDSKWTNKSVTLSSSCSDTGGSGCSKTTFTHTYSTNMNGNKTYTISVTDKAGNQATNKACTSTKKIKIDKDKPYLVSAKKVKKKNCNNGGSQYDFCVWPTVKDDYSGIDHRYYKYYTKCKKKSWSEFKNVRHPKQGICYKANGNKCTKSSDTCVKCVDQLGTGCSVIGSLTAKVCDNAGNCAKVIDSITYNK